MHLKEFSKPTLRGLVDESMAAQYDTLSFVENFIGDETIYDTHYAYEIIQRNQFIAGMIGLGAEKPVVDRHATASKMAEVAHFGLKDVVTIEELYAITLARSNGERDSMVEKLVNKTVDLLDALKLRVRVEKLKALAYGYNEYNKNGVKVQLDYGIPEENKVELTGADTWDNVEKDIIGDLLGWVAKYQRQNGKKPDAVLMTRSVYNNLTNNQMIIAEAGRPEGATRVSTQEVGDVLSRFGLPPITVVEETQQEVKDVETGDNEIIDVYPENRVILASANAGKFLTGPNPDAESMAPVVVAEAYDERTPKRSVIEVSHSGFAVLDNPYLVFHADVVAP